MTEQCLVTPLVAASFATTSSAHEQLRAPASREEGRFFLRGASGGVRAVKRSPAEHPETSEALRPVAAASEEHT